MKHLVECLVEMQSNITLERQLVRTGILPWSETKEKVWTWSCDHPSPASPRSFIHER